MRLRAIAFAAAFVLLAGPVGAQDSPAGLAPADEYFGHFNLSVLGIANSIHDAGQRINEGGDVRSICDGALSFATDAIHAWQTKYPSDPWIAKDLLALETVYLEIPTDDGLHLASKIEGWLVADFPHTDYAARGRAELGHGGSPQASANAPTVTSPWERFAALRAPLPPSR